jgi:hypothetical protein
MTNNERLAQLKALYDATRREIQQIEEAEDTKRHRALVGKCFKYRNCYSMPQKPSDYWWMYCRVDRVRGGAAYGLKFQTDSNGLMSISSERVSYAPAMAHEDGDYKQITKAEFVRALRAFSKRVQGFVK